MALGGCFPGQWHLCPREGHQDPQPRSLLLTARLSLHMSNVDRGGGHLEQKALTLIPPSWSRGGPRERDLGIPAGA